MMASGDFVNSVCKHIIVAVIPFYLSLTILGTSPPALSNSRSAILTLVLYSHYLQIPRQGQVRRARTAADLTHPTLSILTQASLAVSLATTIFPSTSPAMSVTISYYPNHCAIIVPFIPPTSTCAPRATAPSFNTHAPAVETAISPPTLQPAGGSALKVTV